MYISILESAWRVSKSSHVTRDVPERSPIALCCPKCQLDHSSAARDLVEDGRKSLSALIVCAIRNLTERPNEIATFRPGCSPEFKVVSS